MNEAQSTTLSSFIVSDVSYTAEDRQNSRCFNDGSAFELVVLTLTLPPWTFLVAYLLLLLVHYLKSIQYFKLYDKCTPSNAHFKYDFKVVVGKQSTNYSRFDSSLIIDLLDNQQVSILTIQVPGSTLFHENQAFAYRFSRQPLRSASFSIYRKHPIRDVRTIRVAHSCHETDSRLVVYGLSMYDSTNKEVKFFPVNSVVKYRGTHWALNTTFEARNDTSFQKLGCEIFDPLQESRMPTCIELVTIAFYIWCSALFFAHWIKEEHTGSMIALHIVTIFAICGLTAATICVAYMMLIKTRINDRFFESNIWFFVKTIVLTLIFAASCTLLGMTYRQVQQCQQQSTRWAVSSLTVATILTIILMIVYTVFAWRKCKHDKGLLVETETNVMKTNSKQNIEFVEESNHFLYANPQNIIVKRNQKKTPGSASSKAGNSHQKRQRRGSKNSTPKNSNQETLDNAGMTDSAYMKTKNRNSISQYV